jgi:protein TonB
MFEQTLLPDSKGTRKPYSMALSLVLQIFVLAALCLAPFVVRETLPLMQIKSVLAAPPQPPAAAQKMKTAATRIAPRAIRLTDLIIRLKQPLPMAAAQPSEAPPIVAASDQAGVPYGVAVPIPNVTPQPAPPLPPPAIKKPAAKSVTVGGTVAAANLVHMVQPQYPLLARNARIQGVVEFNATISKEGTIENLTLVRGHPLLIRAAREAVLQWRYRPTLLNGEPVEVITDIIVNFTLNP